MEKLSNLQLVTMRIISVSLPKEITIYSTIVSFKSSELVSPPPPNPATECGTPQGPKWGSG
jgi:hypothetical protein